MRPEDRGDEEPVRGELVPAGGPESVREWAEQLVARARADGVALTGEGGLLTDLMRHVLRPPRPGRTRRTLAWVPGSGLAFRQFYSRPLT
jgi:hypothetical protein